MDRVVAASRTEVSLVYIIMSLKKKKCNYFNMKVRQIDPFAGVCSKQKQSVAKARFVCAYTAKFWGGGCFIGRIVSPQQIAIAHIALAAPARHPENLGYSN